MVDKQTTSKKKEVFHARVYIYASFNNTMITLSDLNGNVLCWSSAGVHGFKGSRKSTPYAAQITGEDLIKKGKKFWCKNSGHIYVKGPGGGRENALRMMADSGMKVNYIKRYYSYPA